MDTITCTSLHITEANVHSKMLTSASANLFPCKCMKYIAVPDDLCVRSWWEEFATSKLRRIRFLTKCRFMNYSTQIGHSTFLHHFQPCLIASSLSHSHQLHMASKAVCSNWGIVSTGPTLAKAFPPRDPPRCFKEMFTACLKDGSEPVWRWNSCGWKEQYY